MVLSKSTPTRTAGVGQPRPDLGSAKAHESCRYFFRDVLGCQPEPAARVFLRPDLVHERVVGAETEHATSQAILRREPLCDTAAEPAQTAMFLHDCDERVAPKHFLQSISVQRLDGMKALHARRQPARVEYIPGVEHDRHHVPGADEADMLALAHGNCFSKPEVGLPIVNHGLAFLPDAHVHRAVLAESRAQAEPQLNLITGGQDD